MNQSKSASKSFNNLSHRDVREAFENNEPSEAIEFLMNTYKNVGVQYKGNLNLFVSNSPQIMLQSASSENGESFAKVNRKVKASMDVQSKYVVDELVEQTVSSLGNASFVYNSA